MDGKRGRDSCFRCGVEERVLYIFFWGVLFVLFVLFGVVSEKDKDVRMRFAKVAIHLRLVFLSSRFN